MDLHSLTLPGAIGDLHFEVGRFTGLDRVLRWLPREILRQVVARRIARSLIERGADLGWHRHVTFCLPDETVPTEVIFGPQLEVKDGWRRSITTRPWNPYRMALQK